MAFPCNSQTSRATLLRHSLREDKVRFDARNLELDRDSLIFRFDAAMIQSMVDA